MAQGPTVPAWAARSAIVAGAVLAASGFGLPLAATATAAFAGAALRSREGRWGVLDAGLVAAAASIAIPARDEWTAWVPIAALSGAAGGVVAPTLGAAAILGRVLSRHGAAFPAHLAVAASAGLSCFLPGTRAVRAFGAAAGLAATVAVVLTALRGALQPSRLAWFLADAGVAAAVVAAGRYVAAGGSVEGVACALARRPWLAAALAAGLAVVAVRRPLDTFGGGATSRIGYAGLCWALPAAAVPRRFLRSGDLVDLAADAVAGAVAGLLFGAACELARTMRSMTLVPEDHEARTTRAAPA